MASQDPLPPVRTVYALLQGEESRRKAISTKTSNLPLTDRSACASNNKMGYCYKKKKDGLLEDF